VLFRTKALKEILENFFIRLSKTEPRLLLLDYDGTLAPFTEKRDQAFPYAGVKERLNRLISSKKTVAVIVSGRAISDLKPLLRLRKYPEIWGSHGWERLTAGGEYVFVEPDKPYRKGIESAKNYIHDNKLGKYLEIKPVSLAIHYRGVKPEKVVEIEDKILHNWNELAKTFHLIYSRFDGGLELKIPGMNKGDVVRNICQRYPEGTMGAYLGDDITDEDAFKALPESALGVLVKKERRETAAAVRIKPPEELLAFLDRWDSLDQ
jgi:trehalose-phosphatase